MTTHGTYSQYFRRKCRCEECRAYQRNRVAKNRADRLASGRLSHGARSAYDAGCRCEQCLAARRTKPLAMRHNHFTPDIKRYGLCPACDRYLLG